MNEWKGRRFFSVSGDVKRPGVYEVPMGMTLRELICGEQFCQGIAGDQEIKRLRAVRTIRRISAGKVNYHCRFATRSHEQQIVASTR